ncbi:alpha-(1,3)-fucosyltransferase C-like [Leguminivora glycinivorella]|uniref:alpha-(1,3)-fucosyltransferase C-like n=1 Tax=Leguminivora glycinivorella TaxID=1035111 RepID=UPI00200D23EB|nr:alpha-(1,3)-fucosyltransferase C-like [Leguminivora glycinivorella]
MKRLPRPVYLVSFLFLIIFLYQTSKELQSKNIFKFDIKQYLESRADDLQKKDAVSDNIIVRNYLNKINEVKNSGLKYILLWTSPNNLPFAYMGRGREVFVQRRCRYTNCFVTNDKKLLRDVSKFDVIAFAGPEVVYTPNSRLIPNIRSPHQKYVFASIESAGYYPVCSNRLDNFFNWTWTYRLNSDSRWGYLVVRDAEHKVIGPNIDMHWMKLDDMDPVSEELEALLKQKTLAAVWFVSNCKSKSSRERLAMYLESELEKYGLTLDIFGQCGTLKCDGFDCFKRIQRHYYFYLSFENSFAEDYVTEKLLHALRYNAIPIVYGGANYTRFMPDGIYLNARKLGVKKLARRMKYLIDHPNEYKEYFRWTNHYTYHGRNDDAETDDYCGFCELMNNEELVKNTTIYKHFREWWNDPHHNLHCQIFG